MADQSSKMAVTNSIHKILKFLSQGCFLPILLTHLDLLVTLVQVKFKKEIAQVCICHQIYINTIFKQVQLFILASKRFT